MSEKIAYAILYSTGYTFIGNNSHYYLLRGGQFSREQG